MSQTPFTDLGSQDILSAHLSGVQHAIGNIESVLNMKTAVVTGAPLTPVADQVDASLRYLIYEGAIRNWLGTPTPVIKRGGAVVNPSEYTIYPAYGAIVFAAQQQSSAVITADVTYVTNGSALVDTVNANAASITSLPKHLSVPALIPKTAYVSNYKDLGSPATAATAIQQAPNTIDCFPIYVPSIMTFDRIKFTLNKSTVTGNVILGIYSNQTAFPYQLLGTTALFNVPAGDTINTVVSEQMLTQDLVLNPGLYWIARYQTAGIMLDGVSGTDGKVIEVLFPDDLTLVNASGGSKIIGTRTAAFSPSLTALPTAYPSLMASPPTNGGAQYLQRATVGNMSIKRKA